MRVKATQEFRKMSQIRREVLNAFKALHRTRQSLFQGDERALTEGRKQINENFRKNQSETDEDEIKKMLKVAHDVDLELRKNVIQAVEKEPGVFELRITEETTRLDNYVFNPDAVIERPKRRKGAAASGCSGGAEEQTTTEQK